MRRIDPPNDAGRTGRWEACTIDQAKEPMATTIYENEDTGLTATQYCGPGRQLRLQLDGDSTGGSFSADEAVEAAMVLIRWAREQGAKFGGETDEWKRLAGPKVAAVHETGEIIEAARSPVDGTLRLHRTMRGSSLEPPPIPEGLIVSLFAELDAPSDEGDE